MGGQVFFPNGQRGSVLPSELGDECNCGIVWEDWIGARICWRQKGIRRDGVVDGRVDGESEEPVGAIAEVGVDGSGVSVEFEVYFCNRLVGWDADHGCDRWMREALEDVAGGRHGEWNKY